MHSDKTTTSTDRTGVCEPRLLALSLALALPLPGVAQSVAAGVTVSAEAAAAATLPKITITGSRTDLEADELPFTATAQDAEAITRRQARDLKGLVADEVGVSVQHQPARFTAAGSGTGRAGNAGINIRGLEGNQVLMLLDGVRLPQSFSFGPFVTGRGDFIEPELLASAEILRGPTSAQLGSDGLAGALVLRTLAPQDLLRGERGARGLGGFVRLGGDSADASGVLTAAVAAGTPQLRGLAALTHRRGHELDNQGRNDGMSVNRTTPNPADVRSTTALLKVDGELVAGQRWEAALESRRRQVDTQVLSAVSSSSLSTTTRDHTDRDRLSLGHQLRTGATTGLTELDTRAHLQQAETRQYSAEDRATLADRTRDNRYRERAVGLSSEGRIQTGGALPQRISFGADLSRTHITALRNGTVPPTGETFPARPFPDTDHTLMGAFVQSEIETGDITWMPGLRHDRYRLDPSTEGYSGSVTALSGSAWSPRLGAVWRLDSALQPYAQWATGFRSPEPDQVNSGFSNLASGYTTVGNAALRPERSRGIELGLRGKAQAQALSWQLAAFDNRYRDFIEQVAVSGSGTVADPTVYQSINLDRARIRGVEARATWDPAGPWKLQAAAAGARGSKTREGTRSALNSVDPWQLKASAEYDAGRWSAGLHWTHLAAKSRSRIDGATLFAPGRAEVLDLRGHWQISPTLRLQAAVLNLTDRTYWRWSDVRGLAASSSVIDGYTAPGRSAQLALQADF